MTLRLYVDDCAVQGPILRELKAAGHDPTIPADAGLTGAHDEEHFSYARAHGLVVLTLNPDDFIALHERTPDHAGLLLVYRDNNPARDMTARDIARAIDNLLETGLPIAGQVHILNHWRY